MTAPPVIVELGAVSRLVLNRPDKQNAMNVAMGEAVADAVARVNSHDAARVLLVEGAGRAFSAGGDFDVLKANAGRTQLENRAEMLAFYRRFLTILDVRVPTIAVLQGAAVGAGLCFAMACDFRLAAREAKLGVNFVRVGLHPGMGCSVLLPRLVGSARATELVLTGELIGGDDAARMGLVTAAAAREELPALVGSFCERLARGAPIAVQQAKETLARSLRSELDAALDREAECQSVDFASSDLVEAISAFREGRPPRFEGH